MKSHLSTGRDIALIVLLIAVLVVVATCSYAVMTRPEPPIIAPEPVTVLAPLESPNGYLAVSDTIGASNAHRNFWG